uniref:C2H2-type domain-containing protein n=1 Tax=Octopus bimaculoides TaxID=37653 RepID=A0A0L8HA89_OCTBM
MAATRATTPYYCDICDKSFSQRGSVTMHKHIHTEEKPYHCDICSKPFSGNHVLTKHRHIHTSKKLYHCDNHTEEKPYHCDICGESFSEMSIHKRSHTDTSTFIQERNLIIVISMQPYCCNICDKSFIPKNTLTYKEIHAEEMPHHCDICGKSFSHSTIHRTVIRCQTSFNEKCTTISILTQHAIKK